MIVTKPVLLWAEAETSCSSDAPLGRGRGRCLAAWLATDVVVTSAATSFARLVVGAVPAPDSWAPASVTG